MCFRIKITYRAFVGGTDLAFDPTPMVSHLTLPRLWGRVECEKVAFFSCEKEVPEVMMMMMMVVMMMMMIMMMIMIIFLE